MRDSDFELSRYLEILDPMIIFIRIKKITYLYMHVLVPTLCWCDGRNKVIWSYILGENKEILDEMKYGNSRKILFIKR